MLKDQSYPTTTADPIPANPKWPGGSDQHQVMGQSEDPQAVAVGLLPPIENWLPTHSGGLDPLEAPEEVEQLMLPFLQAVPNVPVGRWPLKPESVEPVNKDALLVKTMQEGEGNEGQRT